MDRCCAKVTNPARQLVTHPLRRAEDYDLRSRRLRPQDLDDPVHLIHWVDYFHVLSNGFVGHKAVIHTTNEDMYSLVDNKLASDVLHLPWPRRRIEQGLPLARNLGNNLLDLGLKAHVQHPVRLIQHQVGNLVKSDLSRLQEVVQATRGGDDNLHAHTNVSQLRPLWSSTIDTRVANSRRSTKLVSLFLDLHRQLPSGGQDQDGWAGSGILARRIDVEEARQEVATSLATARLGNCHHVAAHHRNRPRLSLDRGWFREASAVYLIHDIWGKPHRFKRLERVRDGIPHHCHIMLCAVLSNTHLSWTLCSSHNRCITTICVGNSVSTHSEAALVTPSVEAQGTRFGRARCHWKKPFGTFILCVVGLWIPIIQQTSWRIKKCLPGRW
mmetsp:Transcript_4688/g.11373  ORF Transcript_4688/g.11373 Transcript_4688/m.11373 type:complete len:384 (+) Transcript_4688:1033-2184(+)